MRISQIALISLMIFIPLSASEENNETPGAADRMIDSNVSLEQSVTEPDRHEIDESIDPSQIIGEEGEVLNESISNPHEESDESNPTEIQIDPNLVSNNNDESSPLTDDGTELNDEIHVHDLKESVNEATSKNDESIENSNQDDVKLKNSLEKDNDNLVENATDSEKTANDEESTENDKGEIKENAIESESSEKSSDEESIPKTVFVDYANKSTGALILDKAKNFQGTSNLLLDDKDRYAMIPCNDEKTKYVIIGLSEDILVKSIKLSSFERYSSLTKQFQVLGSQTYPIMTEWEDLGTFEAKPWFKENKEQSFELKTPSWARYLKFRFLSHYGDEHYLTVTQIKVHGSTTLQGYHEMQLEMEANEAEHVEEIISEVETSEENEQPTLSSEKDHVEVPVDTTANEEHHVVHDGIIENDESVDLTTKNEVEDEKSSNDEIVQSELESTTAAETSETVITSTTIDHEKADTSHEHTSSIMERSSDENQIESYENSIEASNNDTDSHEIAEKVNARTESDVNDATAISGDAEEKKVIDDDSISENSSDASNDQETQENVEKGTSQKVNTPRVKEAVKTAIETVQKVATIKDAVKEINKSLHNRVKDDDGQKATESAISDHNRLDAPLMDTNIKEISAGQEDAASQDYHVAVVNTVPSEEKADNDKLKRETVEGVNGTDTSTINSITSNSTQTASTNETNIETTKVISTAASHSKTLESVDVPSEPKDFLKHLTSDYTNADCLKRLDFQEFKKNAMKAIQAQKGSATGTAGSIPKNEPIFKKLSDEIKVLQTSQGIYEQYIKALSTCYESLMSKMGDHIKSIEESQDSRLSSIEEKIQLLSTGYTTVSSTKHDTDSENEFNDQEDESFMIRVLSYVFAFTKCVVVVYHFILDMFESILADERVRKGIEFLLGYKRDISLVTFGYMFSLLLTKYKMRCRNEVVPQKSYTQTSHMDSNESRHNNRGSELPVRLPSLHEDNSVIYSFRSDDISIDGENEDTNHLNMSIKTRL